jgi:hypothetical protein
MSTNTGDSVFQEIQNEVDRIYRELIRFPWADPSAYAAWLAQTYFYVRQVSRVLAAAAARTPLTQPELHEHFLRAITEEKDHSEMCVRDLEELGFDIAAFSEHPLTKAFYQTLLQMIQTHGHASLLGYFFVLEGVAGVQGREIYDVVRNSYRGKALSFVEEHVVLDAEHYPRSLALLKSLSPAELQVVRESTQLAGPIYCYMIRAVRAELEVRAA